MEGTERGWKTIYSYNIQPAILNGACQDIYKNSLVELKETEAQSTEDGNDLFYAGDFDKYEVSNTCNIS